MTQSYTKEGKLLALQQRDCVLGQVESPGPEGRWAEPLLGSLGSQYMVDVAFAILVVILLLSTTDSFS